MPMWRCPHCGTPQAETSRCWVCRRSSTTCSTCRHFQRSLAANVGFCGLDRRRLPLTGSELRGCWEAGALRETATAGPTEAVPDPSLRRRRFIPVEPADPPVRPTPVEPNPALQASACDPLEGRLNRRTLFGDAEA
jgi:hypothetical protein